MNAADSTISVSIVRCQKILNTEILPMKMWRELSKPLETALLGYVQHHVPLIFVKTREGSLRRKKITWLFVCFCQEITFNTLCFRKALDFSRNLHLAICWTPLRMLRPTSAGRVSSKQCFILRAQRIFYCEYMLQESVNKEQFS